jgi:hypothetical protein
MNKHIVKHIVKKDVMPFWGIYRETYRGCPVQLCSSKSGLMNKHIVKHIVPKQTYRENIS